VSDRETQLQNERDTERKQRRRPAGRASKQINPLRDAALLWFFTAAGKSSKSVHAPDRLIT